MQNVQPFCFSALEYGANSAWLNPKNEGQTRCSVYLGKPARATERLFFGLASITIIPIAGALYHGAKAFDARVMLSSDGEGKDRICKHLKATAIDTGVAVIGCVALALLAVSIVEATSMAAMLGKIKAAHTGTLFDLFLITPEFLASVRYDLSVIGAVVSGLAISILPIVFAVAPGRVHDFTKFEI